MDRYASGTLDLGVVIRQYIAQLARERVRLGGARDAD
jgi:hypothetical protein